MDISEGNFDSVEVGRFVRVGHQLPEKARLGDVFFQIGVSPALYACFATNVWTQVIAYISGSYTLDISFSGSSGTVRFYDQTPITGLTKVIIRAAPNQSASALIRIQDSSGSDQITLIDNGSINASNFVVGVGFNANVNGVSLKDVGLMKWSSTSAYNGTADTGFGRLSAGLMSVNDGILGTNYRDLKARKVILDPTTVSGLPAASTDLKGARAIVTDSNSSTFNAIVAGSGSTVIPVFCDGTNWRIG